MNAFSSVPVNSYYELAYDSMCIIPSCVSRKVEADLVKRSVPTSMHIRHTKCIVCCTIIKAGNHTLRFKANRSFTKVSL